MAGDVTALAAVVLGQTQRAWALADVPFLLGEHVGSMLMDTGADVTCVSLTFLEKAGLVRPGFIRPHEGGQTRSVRVASGEPLVSLGVVDLELMVQLMLDVSDAGAAPVYVHWDRRVVSRECGFCLSRRRRHGTCT